MQLPGLRLRVPPRLGETKPGVIGEMGGKVTITSFVQAAGETLSFPTPDWAKSAYFLRTKPGCEYTVVQADAWYMLGIVVRITNSEGSHEFAVFFNIFGYTQVSDLRDPGSDFEDFHQGWRALNEKFSDFFVPWVEFVKSLQRNWQDREEFLFVQGDFWGSFSEDRWVLVRLDKRWKATSVPESFSQMLGRSLEPTSWKILFAEKYRPGKYGE